MSAFAFTQATDRETMGRLADMPACACLLLAVFSWLASTAEEGSGRRLVCGWQALMPVPAAPAACLQLHVAPPVLEVTNFVSQNQILLKPAEL
jgi:hypothetical protein